MSSTLSVQTLALPLQFCDAVSLGVVLSALAGSIRPYRQSASTLVIQGKPATPVVSFDPSG